ncbi:MAG: SDR family NAD(P)-dependent oxidoreductase [Acidimicrobiia bacterium]|nr:SDR family NAD(P)-dependent oxidoreductase [Acidimicrobiia bacterium]
MTVAVTGGSGVVGSALVRHLLASGAEVRALARGEVSADTLRRLGAETVHGDVLDLQSLRPLVAGVDLVFHVAGVNEICPARPRRMWDVNVEGTRNVVEACRLAGVPRLVHTSSASTIGQEKGEIGSESTTHRGWYLSDYERSKSAAERLALEASGELDVVVVNPASVQGPGRATGTGRIFLAAARKRLPVAVDVEVSLVDIDDCSEGHVLAAERGRRGERYLLAGATLRVSDALAVLSEALGEEVGSRFVPPGSLMPVAALVEAVFAVSGRAAPLCREAVRVWAHGHAYDGTRASRELGLRYTPLRETIGRTVEWFRAEGLLHPHR